MVGCAAPFCSNTSEEGYIMRVFPKCPERRALCLRNIPYKNWVPRDNSRLCEVKVNRIKDLITTFVYKICGI